MSLQIASQSKSTTQSRFWNRSFHILPRHSMSMRLYNNNNFNPNNNDDANKETSENRSNKSKSKNNNRTICRLDRKRQLKCWRRCYWKSFMASIIIVLLHLTSIQCLQGRQEGECFFIVFLILKNQMLKKFFTIKKGFSS